MNSFYNDLNRDSKNIYVRNVPDKADVFTCVLGAGVEKTVTVPENAVVAMINAEQNYFLNYDGVAVVPIATDFTAESGGELSPAQYNVENVTTLSFISKTADNTVVISFYK